LAKIWALPAAVLILLVAYALFLDDGDDSILGYCSSGGMPYPTALQQGALFDFKII
jgi:hypothetical protein